MTNKLTSSAEIPELAARIRDASEAILSGALTATEIDLLFRDIRRDTLSALVMLEDAGASTGNDSDQVGNS